MFLLRTISPACIVVEVIFQGNVVMTTSLEELKEELQETSVGKLSFESIMKDLERLPGGLGLLAIREVVLVNVPDGGPLLKKLALSSLVRACKADFPEVRRQEVLTAISTGWDTMSDDAMVEILSVVEQLAFQPYAWDLTSLKRQVARLADSSTNARSVRSARSALSAIQMH